MAATTITADALVGDSGDPLVVRTHGEARVLVFNRPAARNALTLAMRRDFARHTEEAEADETVKALVVTGAGGNFTAGVDLKELRASPRPPMFRPHPAEAVRALTKPVIAAVDGPCVTGGLELALSCSFVIASDRSRFADTHAKVGLFPAWGQSALLPRAIGTRRARQMSLTGAFIDAATAHQWGIANEIVAPEALMTRCLEIAAQIAANDTRSITMQLELLSRNDGASFDTALAAEEAAVRKWRAQRNPARSGSLDAQSGLP